MWRASRTESGFTLVEVLVALAVFAIASLIAYRGLDAVASTKGALDREIRFWRELGLVFERMETDFGQSVPHPLPDGSDSLSPPLRGGSAGSGFVIELARLDGNRAPLHVLYRCDKDKGELTLALAPISHHSEPAAASVPRAVLLRQIVQCDAAFLDAGNVWLAEWRGGPVLPRPRAVRIRLELTGYGRFERIYALP